MRSAPGCWQSDNKSAGDHIVWIQCELTYCLYLQWLPRRRSWQTGARCRRRAQRQKRRPATRETLPLYCGTSLPFFWIDISCPPFQLAVSVSLLCEMDPLVVGWPESADRNPEGAMSQNLLPVSTDLSPPVTTVFQLSHSGLDRVPCLPWRPLEFLDVSYNCICELPAEFPEPVLRSLQYANFSFNRIFRGEELMKLRDCSSLIELDYRGNPCAATHALRDLLFATIASLLVINGSRRGSVSGLDPVSKSLIMRAQDCSEFALQFSLCRSSMQSLQFYSYLEQVRLEDTANPWWNYGKLDPTREDLLHQRAPPHDTRPVVGFKDAVPISSSLAAADGRQPEAIGAPPSDGPSLPVATDRVPREPSPKGRSLLSLVLGSGGLSQHATIDDELRRLYLLSRKP